MNIKSFVRGIVVVAITVVSITACSKNEVTKVNDPQANGVYTSKDGKFVFEDFVITEVNDKGEIRGEKIDGKGEGIYLLDSSLDGIIDSEDEIIVGDEIEVSWTADNYENEIWDNIHGIEFIN